MNSPNVNSPLGCGPNRGGPSRLDIVEFNIEYLQVQSDAFSDTWTIIVIFHFLLKSSEFYWQFGLVFESGIYIVSGADFWCPWSLLWKSFVIFTLEACSGAQNIWFGSFNKKWCMSFIRPKSEQHWLPLSLTDYLLLLRLDWCDPAWVWRFQLKNMLILLLLLLMLCYWWGCVGWGLDMIFQLNFSWGFKALVKILRVKFGPEIGQHFEPEVWLRFGSWNLVGILKQNFGQLRKQLLANLWHDLKAVILVIARNPWARCAFCNDFDRIKDRVKCLLGLLWGLGDYCDICYHPSPFCRRNPHSYIWWAN